MSVQDMYFCEIPTWTWIWAVRHLGSWELGPPSASEMAADLETLPMLTQTPQYRSCPTVQYLHKTAQYAEWGGYNICTCPYLCTYNHMLDSRGGEEGFGGRQEFRRTDLGRWVLPSGVLAGPQGYIDTAQGYRPTMVVYWRSTKDIEENLHLASTHCRWPTGGWDEIFCNIVSDCKQIRES